MDDIKFYQTPVQKMLLIARIRQNPSLKEIFKKKKNVTQQINDEIHDRLNGYIDNFFTIFLTGVQGCQPRGSKVLMANGEWKNIEEIKIGDDILSPQADNTYQIGKVEGITTWISKENYEVRLLNNQQKKLYSCSWNHLIPMNKREQPRINKKENKRLRIWKIKNIPAQRLSRYSKASLQAMSGIFAPLIPRFKGQRNPQIEPYTLGYFLGNGSFITSNPAIYAGDPEPLKYIRKHYRPHRISINKKKTCKAYFYKSKSIICKHLIKMGLKGKKAGTKEIPQQALLADAEYRKKLLAGLIDSDGTFNNCTLSITTKSDKLAEQISYLASTLGLRNNITKQKSYVKSTGFSGIYNLITIYVNGINLPILLKRKRPFQRKFYLSSNRRSIDIIPLKGAEQVYGFSIDTPSRLYITDNWCVTHNSFKSSCAMTIMKNADPQFNIKRIHFQYEPFRGSIQTSQPKEGFQLDESVFTHGMGANRLVQEIQNLIETLRKRQNSLIIVSPEMKYFPENIFTYIIETLDTAILATCPDNPSLHEPRNCTCWHSKTCKIHHCYVRTAIKTQGYYIGFYIIPIDWESPLWKEYSQEKNKFMEEITTGQIHNSDYQQIARTIMEDPEYENYNKNKKTLRLLIERRRPTLTISESDAVATQIKIFEQTGDFE